MTSLILDVETSNKKDRSPTPYDPLNYLVSVGYSDLEGNAEYLCFRHDTEPSTEGHREILQAALDRSDLLIGHNIKFDLSWLLECGFEYPSGNIYDTMGWEYLYAGGANAEINLNASCKRWGLPTKVDAASELFKEGYSFAEMPWDIVEEYGRQDVESTRRLYLTQLEQTTT